MVFLLAISSVPRTALSQDVAFTQISETRNPLGVLKRLCWPFLSSYLLHLAVFILMVPTPPGRGFYNVLVVLGTIPVSGSKAVVIAAVRCCSISSSCRRSCETGAPRPCRSPLERLVAQELQEFTVRDVAVPSGVLRTRQWKRGAQGGGGGGDELAVLSLSAASSYKWLLKQ